MLLPQLTWSHQQEGLVALGLEWCVLLDHTTGLHCCCCQHSWLVFQ
jgi:hypothetical protein